MLSCLSTSNKLPAPSVSRLSHPFSLIFPSVLFAITRRDTSISALFTSQLLSLSSVRSSLNPGLATLIGVTAIMKVKVQGWPTSLVSFLVITLCFLAEPLDAGPIQFWKSQSEAVSTLPSTPTSAAFLSTASLRVSNGPAGRDAKLPSAGSDTQIELVPPLEADSPDLAPAPTQREAGIPMHDFALVCDDRDWTTICAKLGYICTAAGKVHTRSREDFCDLVCECVSVKAGPAALQTCLIMPQIVACRVSNGVAIDTTSGQVLGTVSSAQTLPDGTLDFSPASVVTRDADLSWGHYILECGGDESTTRCAEDPYKYFCTLSGTVMRAGELSQSCSACDCQPLSLGHSDLDQLDDSRLLTGNDFHVTNAIAKRDYDVVFNSLHSYALVCFERSYTQLCAASRYGYSCTSKGALSHCGREWPYCDAICECVSLSPKYCILDPSKQSSCLVNGNLVYTDNGTFVGNLLDAKVRDDGSLDFSAPAAKRALALRDSSSQFKMYCRTPSHSSALPDFVLLYNKSLTKYCAEYGYSCVQNHGNDIGLDLHHDAGAIQECETSCQCPIIPFPAPSKQDLTHQSEEVTDTVNQRRSLDLDMVSDIEKLSDAVLIAPPSGVPYQPSDIYALNCGNREDGPPLCRQATLGYFCSAEGTVARTSINTGRAVTWCDYYCKCIFANPTPCVNEWNVPYCQEMLDGTVRDAFNMEVVLGLVDNVFVMPNGSVMVDRGRPYIVGTDIFVSRDGNGTWYWSGSNNPPH